jgi:hypothetical protein
MSVSVRPQTKLAAALVAAGVVSAAVVVNMPARPTISVDVGCASAVTDALYSLGKGTEVLSSLVGIHVDATISLPFEATLAVMAAAQNPELSPNVLSYLVQRFVNPAVGPPITAYPWETEQTAALVASLLPYPLGPSATEPGLVLEAARDFADLFNDVLGRLPDPLPGFDAVQAVMNDTVLGGAVVAGQLAVRAPLYMAWNTANYLGNVPVNLEATLESAIATPNQIPGLVSNLVYGLLSPDAKVGLLGQLLNNAVDPATWLPAPIGFGSNAAVGLANQARDAITAAVNGFLSMLPAPVTPSALPAVTAPQAQPTYSVDAGKGSTAPDSIPSASIAAVTVVPMTSPEKGSDTTASKVKTPEVAATDARATGPDSGAADRSELKDGRDGDAKDGDAEVRPGGVKPAKVDTIKDEATRPSTRDDQTKPDKVEPGKTEPRGAHTQRSGRSGTGGTSKSPGEAAA